MSSSSSIVGNWHYFTWVYDPSTGGGTQSIYEDGSLLGSAGGHGKYANGGNLEIGNTDFENASIDGTLDDIRVYNTSFSATDVANLYSDSSKPDTPEPASLGLLGVGAIGLLARRRRD